MHGNWSVRGDELQEVGNCKTMLIQQVYLGFSYCKFRLLEHHTLRISSRGPLITKYRPAKKENTQSSKTIGQLSHMSLPRPTLTVSLLPLGEGPDLPEVQLLLGHPALDHDRARLLGRLRLLRPQSAGAKAFPLGGVGLCGAGGHIRDYTKCICCTIRDRWEEYAVKAMSLKFSQSALCGGRYTQICHLGKSGSTQ